jgi:hypothetical protein
MNDLRFRELGRKIFGGEIGTGHGLDYAEQKELFDELCRVRETLEVVTQMINSLNQRVLTPAVPKIPTKYHCDLCTSPMAYPGICPDCQDFYSPKEMKPETQPS